MSHINYKIFVVVIPNESSAVLVAAKLLFFWCSSDKDLETCFSVAQLFFFFFFSMILFYLFFCFQDFHCSFCTKTFKTKILLRVHEVRIHAGAWGGESQGQRVRGGFIKCEYTPGRGALSHKGRESEVGS